MFAPLYRVLPLLCVAFLCATPGFAADAPKTAAPPVAAPVAPPKAGAKPEPKPDAKPLAEADAAMAALTVAGCGRSGDCAAKGKFDAGANRWVFVVTYVPGKGDDGRPLVVGAGAMRVTLDAYGEVIERVGVAQP